MISNNTLAFIKELEDNNNREWFTSNKKRYDSARIEFEQFVQSLIEKLHDLEPEIASQQAKDTLFRIYRDVRFSTDKTPYKTHICAYLCTAGRKSIKPGYYLHIKPDNHSFLAGGVWMPPAPELKAIRQEIDYNFEEFNSLLQASEFKQYFGSLQGEQLKTTPKGYATDHPGIEHLRRKSLNMSHSLSDELVTSAGFADYLVQVMKAMKPVNDFLMRGFEE